MSLNDVKLHLVDSIDEVLKLNEWLGARRPHHMLAVDTETTGLIIGRDHVRLVQIGDAVHGFAIPLDRWGGVFEDVVRRWDGTWLAHNAKFDVSMLDHANIVLPRSRVWDTRIMAHVVAPHYSTALKNVAARLVDAHAGSLQADLKDTSWTWETVPITYQPYWTYAALDAVLTYKVFEVLWPKIVEDGVEDAFHLENEVSWIVANMERYGAHIDREFAETKLRDFNEYVEKCSRWVKDTYGVAAGSNPAVVRVLQEAGYEFSKATATGAVALDKEVLGAIDHPLAQTVLARRQIQKLASTYLSHFVTETDEDDLIHPSINVLGARTSRMSMERPNLQNLPRKSEANPAADTIRRCVSARPGNTMLMCDFDQVEMRLLASMAREQSMIAAFRGPEDFFVALAKMVYRDDKITKLDPRRQVVKNAGYATIYGAGVEKFSVTAGIPLEQGREVRRRWDELFPGVVRFQQEVVRLANARKETEGLPYVRCPVTHRRQIGDPGKEYALVNFLIQGAAAAVLKRKLIELDNAGLGPYMVVPVHDEVILDIPAEHVSEATYILRQVMNDNDMFSVPLSASVSHGDTWADKIPAEPHHIATELPYNLRGGNR